MRIVTAAMAVLAILLAVPPASALPRQREIVAQAGTPARVSYYTHFNLSSCEAISMPNIVVRQQPMKGTMLFAEKVLPIQKASGERAQHCIGKPIRSVVVQYIPWANASGDDQVLYDVIYPRTCPLCQRYEVTLKISIVSGPAPPARADAPLDDGN
jgi:hypothetical protein